MPPEQDDFVRSAGCGFLERDGVEEQVEAAAPVLQEQVAARCDGLLRLSEVNGDTVVGQGLERGLGCISGEEDVHVDIERAPGFGVEA